jgi:hypothetical protein
LKTGPTHGAHALVQPTGIDIRDRHPPFAAKLGFDTAGGWQGDTL